MAAASLDWVVCDFAIWAAGAVTVPVYETSSAEQIRWILSDSGAVAVLAGSTQHAEAIKLAQVPTVEAVWVLGDGGLDALARAGAGISTGEVRRRRAVTAETLATIVYTSGTTGVPKGCMISHGNLTEAVRATIVVPGIRDRVLAGDASCLFFLPLSHILARVVSPCLVHVGKRVAYLPDPGQLPAELAAFRPTIMLGVPRVFEKLAAAARQQAEAGGHRRLFAAAENAAIGYSRAAGRPGVGLRLRRAVFAAKVPLTRLVASIADVRAISPPRAGCRPGVRASPAQRQPAVGPLLDPRSEAAADPVKRGPKPPAVCGAGVAQPHVPGLHRHHGQGR